MGSFNLWNMQLMKAVPGTTDTVEISFPVGPHLCEEFQFARDKDLKQVFYPDKGNEVCGPGEQRTDNLGKKFKVRGQQFDIVRVQFTLKDGAFSASARSSSGGTTTWGSESAFAIT